MEVSSKGEMLEDLLMEPLSPIYLHTLMDFMTAFVLDLKQDLLFSDNDATSKCSEMYRDTKSTIMEIQKRETDFLIIKNICQAMYGTVYLVRHPVTKMLYDMKVIQKDSFFIHHMNERNAMVSANSPWLMRLHCAFQNKEFLHLVTDHVPGGDLETHLKNVQLSEGEVMFYVAEILLALEAFHSMNYVHGAVSLNNILLDANGHVILTEYGVCGKMNSNGKVEEDPVKETGYGKEVDWNALGECISVMLLEKTSRQVKISNNACNLLVLLSKMDSSLTCEQIKNHKWFQNSRWTFDTIRTVKPPIEPDLQSYTDDQITNISYTYSKTQGWFQTDYIGFTYFKQSRLLSLAEKLVHNLTENSLSAQHYDIEVKEEEKDEIKTLKRMLSELLARITTHERKKSEAMNKVLNEVQHLKKEITSLEKQMEYMKMKGQKAQLEKELSEDFFEDKMPSLTHMEKFCEQQMECEEVSEGQSSLTSEAISIMGHEFVQCTSKFHAKCEHCVTPLRTLFKHYDAMMCRKCRIQCHKHHVVDEQVLATCTVTSRYTKKDKNTGQTFVNLVKRVQVFCTQIRGFFTKRAKSDPD